MFGLMKRSAHEIMMAKNQAKISVLEDLNKKLNGKDNPYKLDFATVLNICCSLSYEISYYQEKIDAISNEDFDNTSAESKKNDLINIYKKMQAETQKTLDRIEKVYS